MGDFFAALWDAIYTGAGLFWKALWALANRLAPRPRQVSRGSDGHSRQSRAAEVVGESSSVLRLTSAGGKPAELSLGAEPRSSRVGSRPTLLVRHGPRG
jgi:hypothetical protein